MLIRGELEIKQEGRPMAKMLIQISGSKKGPFSYLVQ